MVSVLDCLAHRDKQFEPFPGAELVLVTVFGDRDAPNQLHNEVWSAGLRGSGIKDLGHVGVIHHCQGLTLDLKAGNDLLGIHTLLDDLQGDFAMDGLLLLGHVDDGHPTLSDLL
jgi:hypothetical protein